MPRGWWIIPLALFGIAFWAWVANAIMWSLI